MRKTSESKLRRRDDHSKSKNFPIKIKKNKESRRIDPLPITNLKKWQEHPKKYFHGLKEMTFIYFHIRLRQAIAHIFG